MDTIVIRRGNREDVPAIAAIEARCFPAAEAATWQVFQQRMETFPESFFVAETDGKIVGFINGAVIEGKFIRDEMYENAGCHNPQGNYQTVFGIDVLPEYQGRHIASQLMETMIRHARQSGRKGVVLTCKEALFPFYETFSFVCLGRSQSVHGGAVWYDMIREWDGTDNSGNIWKA